MYSSPTPGTGVFQPLAALTLQSGGSAPAINIDRIVQVEDYNSGSRVHWLTENGTVSSFDVDETPTEIAAVVPLVNLTLQLYLVNDSSTLDIWVLADCISDPFDLASGARVTLLTSIQGFSKVVDVTQSAADIIAAQAAASMIPENGTWGNLTATGAAQGTAAAITTNNVNITAGAAGTGVILTAGTAGERVIIKNKTATGKKCYPAAGEFIDERSANIPFDIPAYGQIELVCGVAGTWTTFRDDCVVPITGAGVTQVTGTKIPSGTDIAVLSASVGDTAFVLPIAVLNARIQLVNPSAVTARVFPTVGEQIGTLGVNAVLTIAAGASVSLISGDPATGAWTFMASRAQHLWADEVTTPTITESFGGSNITLQQFGGTPFAVFNTASADYSVGLKLHDQSVTAFAGGGQVGATQLNSNNTTIEVCATALDSVLLLSAIDFAWVTNNGVAAAAVYGEVGYSMDGTVDGFVTVQPGQSFFFRLVPGTTRWLSTIVTTGAQSGTANVGSTQATGTPIVNAAVNCTVCANAGDAFTIQPYTPRMFYFSNNGANAADVFPVSGGTINGAAADAAISVAAAAEYIFFTNDGITWLAVLQ